MRNIAVRTKWPGFATVLCPGARVVALVFIVALAAGFRLYHLGVPAFGADTMHFFDFCHRPLSGWVIFTQWMELMGRTSQLPFSVAITKCFIDILHLAPTDFMIRLPSALFGILTVLSMYMLGRQLAGRSFGLLLALWMAVNPFHIQLSQESYFYPPVLLGVTLQAWACLWAYRHRNQRTSFPIRFHVVTQVGFFLMTYSHVSGWWVGVLFVPFLGWTLGRRAWHEPRAWPDFWWWLSLTVIIGLPLVFMDWGLPYFLNDALSPQSKTEVQRIFGERQAPFAAFVGLLLKSASWGATPLRVGVLLVTGVLTITALVFNRIRHRRAWMMVLFLLVGFLIYYLSLITTNAPYGQRHVAFLLPLYLSVLAYGVWHISAIPFVRRGIKSPVWRRIPAYGLAAIAVAISIQPAWIATQLTGHLLPYKEVARWCDTQLPSRSLVLVDRWFEPWNELRVNNSTNVYFAFTIPNEPMDVYLKVRWRDTAKAFFEKFPDAAFFERKSYYDRPEVGPWPWPSQYFARKVTFSNEAAIKLRDMGLGYRVDSSAACSNMVVISLYYNTRADVLEKAGNQGKSSLVIFGPEWGYVKLWQQYRDFRDWRILEDKATLDVYNLTPQTNTVTLLIRGMAANGAKRVRFGILGQADFQNTQLAEWRIERVPLQPGLNQFVLSDALWSVARIPLLVDRIEVLTTDPPAPER